LRGQGAARLSIPPRPKGYAVAQLDDGSSRARQGFPHRPPLHLRLRARASTASPTGTLGFGFWNDPFSLSLGQKGAARRLPAPPVALWFFHASPPYDVRFLPHSPGHGWKAVSLRFAPLPSALLLAAAPIALGASYLPLIRPLIHRAARRMTDYAEAHLAADLTGWHEYSLVWTGQAARFSVDGETVLQVESPPAGPLALVLWIDNQYATFSPRKPLHFGVLPTRQQQWLEIDQFDLSPA